MFSKSAHIPIIKEIAKGLQAAGKNRRYIELGIAKAACFNEVAPLFVDSIAVDVNLKAKEYIKATNSQFFNCNCDTFFSTANLLIKASLIFIDANHDYKNVKADFQNSWNYTCENGIIILHDTYPPSEEYKEHCKDAYKICEYLKSQNIEFITLPFYFGLTIVRKT